MAWMDRVAQSLRGSRRGSHLVRATIRYFNRLGNQLAASIAFFSILALVPVLMFAFSAVGLVLTVIRPDLLGEVQMFIVENINAGPLQDQVLILVARYLYNWRQVGLFALAVALVIGSTWVANLKGAIRGMGRPSFDVMHRKHSVLFEPLKNIGLLLVFMILMALTFTSTVIGIRLTGSIVAWAELGNVYLSQGLLQGASLTLSLGGAVLLFWLMYRFLPNHRSPNRAIIGGSLGAGISYVLLQAGASYLTELLALSRSTQVFGPVIVAMLFINIFAQLALFWAAWIATWNQPAIAGRYSPADEILRDRTDLAVIDRHWELADADRARRQRPPKRLGRQLADNGSPLGGPVRIGTGATAVDRSR